MARNLLYLYDGGPKIKEAFMWKRYLVATVFIAAFAIVFGNCTHENTRFWETIEAEGPATSGGVETPTEPPVEPPVGGFKALKAITYKGLDKKGQEFAGTVSFTYADGRLVEAKDTIESYEGKSTQLVREVFSYNQDGKVSELTRYNYSDGQEKLQYKAKYGYANNGIINSKERENSKIEYTHKFSEAGGKIVQFEGVVASGQKAKAILPPPEGFGIDSKNLLPDKVIIDVDKLPFANSYIPIVPIPPPSDLLPMEFKENVFFNADGFPTKTETPLFTTEYSYINGKFTDKKIALGTGDNLNIQYGSDGMPEDATIKWTLVKIPDREISLVYGEDGVLNEESVKQEGKVIEKRTFVYESVEAAPVMPPLYWVKPFEAHASTLYASEPAKLFGNWMFINP